MNPGVPRPPSEKRETAWSWLVTNLVVLPGLGSILAGRKVGYLQAVMALSGMILSLVFVVSIVREWWVLGGLPPLDRRWLVEGAGGLALFGLGWLWGLGTGLSLVRESRRDQNQRD